jgi:hypothetical protein
MRGYTARCYRVGGFVLSADDVEHGILRGARASAPAAPRQRARLAPGPGPTGGPAHPRDHLRRSVLPASGHIASALDHSSTSPRAIS